MVPRYKFGTDDQVGWSVRISTDGKLGHVLRRLENAVAQAIERKGQTLNGKCRGQFATLHLGGGLSSPYTL